MANRDIPEINAGSMADIAFLLLLFFLVTTTMDKDQAYVRNIPKKIEIPPEDLPDVQKRNICNLRLAVVPSNIASPSHRHFVMPTLPIENRASKLGRTRL